MHFMKNKRMSFRDELQKTLLTYAMFPLLAASAILVVVLGYILLNNVVYGSKWDAQAAAQQLDGACAVYHAKLSDLARRLDPDLFADSSAYRAQVNAEIYQFINERQERPRFYLMDGDQQLVFSTENSNELREESISLIFWRLNRALREADQVTMLGRAVTADASRAYLMLGRRLDDPEKSTEAYLSFLIPESTYARLLADLGSSVLITDYFDTLFISGSGALTSLHGKLDQSARYHSGFFRSDDNTYYCSYQATENGLFHVYAVRECGHFLNTILVLALLVLAIFLVILCAILLSARRIAARKMKIIDDITSACQRAQVGDLTTRLNISSHDEFEVIGDAYNSMIDSIRSLMERSVVLAKETAISRVKQLESQFNPHFLFNTLENVRYMIRLNPKAANDMIVSLSELLRYSINDDKELVPLTEDMTYISHYVQILKMRFGSRLQYELELPPALENYRLPRLIVQPVIENSVKYCMESRDTLTVHVSVFVKDDLLVIRVQDNGNGIPAETLERIHESLRTHNAAGSGHLGLLNVNERIRLMYGETYGVRLLSSDKGTTVELLFPYQTEEASHDS